jgi:hypothetical protein
MTPSKWLLTGALLACAALVLGGCAATGGPAAEPAAPPAAVQLGPVIRLLDIVPTTDRVRAVAARDGSVHVLVASARPRVVTEIVVSPAGGVERRPVLADVAPSTLDAAFDRDGRLHALVDREHLVCQDGAWRRSERTPWQPLGVAPDAARFVPNAPDLVWVFPVRGSELGATGRWEVYGFGGGRAGIIWPWFTRGSRTVVVADSAAGFGPWIVIDPEGAMDTAVIDATADDAGNVYLAYLATRHGMLLEAARFYARLEPDALAGKDGVAWRPERTPSPALQLRAARGQPLASEVVVRGESSYRPNAVPYPPHFFGGGVDGGLRLSTSVTQRPRALVVAEAHDKWYGHDFPIQYVEFDDLRWSAPIEVGLADHGGGMLGGIWHAFDLATTDSGRTFAVWPTAHGIVGRWIDGRQ